MVTGRVFTSEHIDGELLLVSEAVCQQVIDQAAAFEAVAVVFAAMARGDAQNFPVVRQAIGHADALTYCNTTVKIERNY